MSLAHRLQTVQASRSNTGCATCAWIKTLNDADKAALDAWVRDGLSIAQLHDICSSDETNPLNVSDSAFRSHLRRHHRPQE